MSATVNVSKKRNRWHGATGRVVGVRFTPDQYEMLATLATDERISVGIYVKRAMARRLDFMRRVAMARRNANR